MRLTYIFHSGFALETEQCILVFDYWMDPAGVMPTLLQSSKPIYVFASHFHEDHFNRTIFQWKNMRPDILYILSKDILKRRRAQKEEADVWLAKGGVWQDDRIRVTATGSTDSGVSWMVQTGGRCIFHAGDLNNWYAHYLTDQRRRSSIFSAEFNLWVNPEKEEKQYLGELKDIRKVTGHFDLVMFPIDSRIGNGYTRGGRQFIEQFSVALFVPMHFVAGGFESAWRMREFTGPRGVGFWSISRNGESLEF